MNAPLARLEATVDDPLWYKDAVIYQLHIKSFFDSNNDGIGDFPGLISKLDYIADLGATAIWLLPFYPSPRLDDGFDISECRAVHPDYGTMADVRRFIHAAHARGIRVITELVINHTSDQHPWFQRARHAKPGSAAREFYVWSDSDQKYAETRIIFVDTERSNWTWDPAAGAYFWHRFYSHQPDLNYDNPRVLKAMLGVMRYWLELGVDGFRLDAVPYLIEREGTNNENLPETHAILRHIRAELDAAFPGRMLLAEAAGIHQGLFRGRRRMPHGIPFSADAADLYGDRTRGPVSDNRHHAPDAANSRELSGGDIPAQSRRAHAGDGDRLRAGLSVGGLRRRPARPAQSRHQAAADAPPRARSPAGRVAQLPAALDARHPRHLLRRRDRHGRQHPSRGSRRRAHAMQWTPDRNGGFSRADPAALVLPAIMDPLYGFESVNVEAQSRDSHSLLNWTRRMLAVRGQHMAFGRGALRFLYPRNRKILAYLREHKGETILCVANVARSPQAVELDLSEFVGRVPIELNNGSPFPPIGQLTYLLTLPPYGFYWFILAKEADWPSWHTPAPEPMPEYRTIVLRSDLAKTLLDSGRHVLEREVLPPYLAKRRWFAAKDETLQTARLAYLDRLPGVQPLFLAEIETTTTSGTARWLIPLALVWEGELALTLSSQLALAHVRRERRVGLLTDAFAVPAFAHQIIALLAQGACRASPDGEIRFESTLDRVDSLQLPAEAEINWLSAEQSNSSLIVGDAVMLKIFRRIAGGQHPEAEMGRYLTQQGFANTPALLGEIARIGPDGTRFSLAIAQGFVRNQGDAWSWLLDQLLRALDDLTAPAAAGDAEADHMSDYEVLAAAIGQRLGDLHVVLARPSEDPAFAPATATAQDVARWREHTRARLEAAFAVIAERKKWDRPDDEARAAVLQKSRRALLAALHELAQAGAESLMSRIHGDFHLGQVLVVSGDVYIIDFEGEPARPLAERRAKSSPLRDVAGILRSFDYAAATIIDRKNVGSAPVSDERRDEFIARFRVCAPQAFLKAYRATISATGATVSERLLDMFLLEKAAYELTYEAANRPSWLGVPLAGLSELARRVLQDKRGGEHGQH